MRLVFLCTMVFLAVVSHGWAFDHRTLTFPDQRTGPDQPDSESRICIDCHLKDAASEGHLAPAGGGRKSPIAFTAGASHPIGIDYLETVRGRGMMNPQPGLHLPEGKVGCTTCHEIFSNFPYFLSDANVMSSLCRRCHSGY